MARHLERIFAGDAETIAFMQRLYGYGLTGHTGEQVFVINCGEGANGKAQLMNAWWRPPATMPQPTQITTFTPHRNDAIRNDLAALAGARLVTASETRIRQTLDTALVKQLTGNDPDHGPFPAPGVLHFRAAVPDRHVDQPQAEDRVPRLRHQAPHPAGPLRGHHPGDRTRPLLRREAAGRIATAS